MKLDQATIAAGIRVMEHYAAVELKKMQAIAAKPQPKPQPKILSSR